MHGKLFWIAILSAAGLAANELFTIPVHSGAAFRLGHVFVLLTAIALGPRAGAVTALIASWPMIAVGEAHLAALSIAEAFIVGHWVNSSRRWMPLTSDLAFWALGSPLLLAWTAREVGLFSAMAWVPAIHAPVNGALCAVTADVLLLVWTTRIPGPRRLALESRQPLRWHLVHWLAFITLVPMLVVGLAVGRERASEKAAEAESSLRGDVEEVAGRLEALIAENLRAVETLGRQLTSDPTDESEILIARLEASRLTYEAISTLLVADGNGELIAGAPATRDGVKWWGGSSVVERQYFRVPKDTGQSMVSDVFAGVGFSSTAIVGLSAPIFGADGQEVVQVVEASLDVRELQRRVRPRAFKGELLVVDRDLHVLFALGDSQQRPLTALRDSRLVTRARTSLSGDIRLGKRARDGGISRDDTFVIWRPIPVAGWTVIGQRPTEEADQAAVRVYLGYSSGLLLAVILTSLFATAIASRLTWPIERLVSGLRDAEADSLPTAPEMPSTAPREVTDLVESFGAMSGRLEQSYQELRHSLDERQALNWELEELLGDLDRRVRERTDELAASRREAVELQRLYRGLLDDIEAIVCEFDFKKRRFTFVSQRSGEILGYEPEAWYADRAFWYRLLPRDERQKVLKEIQRIAGEGGKYVLEHSVQRAGGEIIFLRNVGRVLLGDDGTQVLRCVMLDVTAAKQAQEDQLRRQHLESVGTLAGGIAHDFNNLLTTILGNLSLARLEMAEGANADEYLDHIDDAGQNARRLSHQLLTFARGGQPILKACNLQRRLHELARTGRIAVKVEAPSSLPKVLADRQQLRQIIHEILRNAEQAMPEGGRVDVIARAEEVTEGTEMPLTPGPYVTFTVRDTGEGVPADLMSRVFDPYFTTKEEGRGFGLAATYSMVQSHRGHISFHSVRGHGTSVTVWLPAALEAPVEAETKITVGEQASPGRLLLMDDESSVRLVARRMFERLGWEVVATADGAEALVAYQEARQVQRPFDLVFTDLTVPGGMGGAETMRRLQEIDSEVRAVVCSGYSNDPVMAQFRDHGFVGVMTKPFSLGDLKRILEQAMREAIPA